MPRQTKGARLWLKPGEPATETRAARQAVWIIQDGTRRISTGCGKDDRRKAEERLAAHILERYEPARASGRGPAEIQIADILNIYAEDRGQHVKRPVELGQRMSALLGFFGEKSLSEISGALCRAYVKQRGSVSMARRELEDLRAAIRHHRREGLSDIIVEVPLPEKSVPRERWLTRSEAARLIWHLWSYREVQKGKATGRHSRRHVARFVLVALYTGTRAGTICGAAIRPTVGQGFVDLKAGVFYRRALGERETKKRKPTIRLPKRLLAHLRRWERLGISKSAIVEWNGQAVGRINKAFAAGADGAGLPGLVPHMLRHTAVTWAMQGGANRWDACDYFGLTMETLEKVYGHHAPDHQESVTDAFDHRRTFGGLKQRDKTRTNAIEN
jgi:integrase